MAIYNYRKSETHSIYPKLTVSERLKDGEPVDYRLTPDKGYVFYNTTENLTAFDEETETEVPIKRYCTVAYLPLNYDFDKFPFVAVPVSEAIS